MLAVAGSTGRGVVSRSWGRPGLWAIVGSHVLADFYIGAVVATLPFLVTEAGYSYAQIAGLALALTAVASIAQPGFGVLADCYRLRWAVPGCIAVTGICMSLSTLASDHYPAVWAMIALAGVASAGYHPPATLVVRDIAPGSNTTLSVFAAAGNLGVALGPIAVVLVVGVGGLQATPLLMVPGVAGLALYALAASHDDVLQQRARVDPGVGDPGRAATADRLEVAGVEAAVLSPPCTERLDRWGMFARLLVPMTAWQVSFTATSAFVGVFVIDEFGASKATASLPLTLFPAAGAAGTLMGGWLADRIGRLAVIRLGYSLALAGAVAMTLAPSAWLTIVATCLVGGGVFMPFAPQLTLAHSYLPRRVGAASGLSIGLTSALGGVITAALGHVADTTGLRMVFTLMAACLAVGVAGAFALRDPKSLPHPRAVRASAGPVPAVEASL